MLWQHILVSSTLFAGTLSISASHVLHEKRSTPFIQKRQRVDGNAVIPVRLGLRQQNLHTGYERLMEVSDPASERYGKHLSKEQVNSIFEPAEATAKIVNNWLLGSGLFDENDIVRYENKGWLTINMPTRDAETLLGTEYYEMESDKGEIRIGCDEYYLPTEVSKHIDFVKPGVKLSSPLRKRQVEKRSDNWNSSRGNHRLTKVPYPGYPSWKVPPAATSLPLELQTCGVNITPSCIRALYGIPAAHAADPTNAMGIFATYDAFSQKDISLFFKKYAKLVAPHTKPKVISVDGGTAPAKPKNDRNGGESDIDLDMAISLIYPQTVTVYQVDDQPNSSGETGTSGFINTFLDSIDGSYCNYTAFGIKGDSPGIDAFYPDALHRGFKGSRQCGTYELTRVLSISYGEAESDLPKPYVERQCSEIMKLGLQGHSILVSTGDFGVASFPGDSGDERGCLSSASAASTVYNPDYSAGCPYITAVGGTRLYPNQEVKDPESAMQVNVTALHLAAGSGDLSAPLGFFATGGGFSNYFTPPAYQATAVANYFRQNLSYQSLPYYTANSDASNIGQNGGVYNRAGRGYPDVSANGAFFLAFRDLEEHPFIGTSLSAPLFASVVTLLNEARTSVGKGPIGFINPALYANPRVLNDITNGSNPNCGSQGFQASKGWDPVTGLGTPNYPRMLAYFLSLP
ncbi:Aorsin [Lachnellula suecica]|uniref:Aorsin n=1 Tax=Lachnellula suecica TaxID=602035 RepID=A0A8T9CE65_9HELO|nr:Aorsin [Lachnellula suecica]